MRNGVGDPGWRVAFGNLEQSSGLAREPLSKRNIGFALLRWLTAEHHALEREGVGRK